MPEWRWIPPVKKRNLCADVRQLPIQALGQQLHITLSIGLSVCPLHGEDPASLIHAADAALYQAKAQGRTGCVWQGESASPVLNQLLPDAYFQPPGQAAQQHTHQQGIGYPFHHTMLYLRHRHDG
jgi:hypothetical protein